jgi:hypothetical protein
LEGWLAGVDALDLVYVCWVHGRGEEAEVYLGAVGGGDGVFVQAGGLFSLTGCWRWCDNLG